MESIARSLLRTSTKCRHCQGVAKFEYLDGGLIAVHVCPGRYVSRIVAYGEMADPPRFMEFVEKAALGLEKVEAGDIRTARRYAWDLGLESESDDLVLREAYWTQNYRRTKKDEPDRPALFLCSNRDSFFVQPLPSGERYCEGCRSR